MFCHATPRDDAEVVLVDSGPERWADVFADLDDEVRTIVCGHTHMPFTRLVDRRLVVNPGSVGVPDGGPGAHWALLDTDNGGGTLRRTLFRVDAACAWIATESSYDGAAGFADYFVRSAASDIDALRVLGPRSTEARGRAAPPWPQAMPAG